MDHEAGGQVPRERDIPREPVGAGGAVVARVQVHDGVPDDGRPGAVRDIEVRHAADAHRPEEVRHAAVRAGHVVPPAQGVPVQPRHMPHMHARVHQRRGPDGERFRASDQRVHPKAAGQDQQDHDRHAERVPGPDEGQGGHARARRQDQQSDRALVESGAADHVLRQTLLRVLRLRRDDRQETQAVADRDQLQPVVVRHVQDGLHAQEATGQQHTERDPATGRRTRHDVEQTAVRQGDEELPAPNRRRVRLKYIHRCINVCTGHVSFGVSFGHPRPRLFTFYRSSHRAIYAKKLRNASIEPFDFLSGVMTINLRDTGPL